MFQLTQDQLDSLKSLVSAAEAAPVTDETETVSVTFTQAEVDAVQSALDKMKSAVEAALPNEGA